MSKHLLKAFLALLRVFQFPPPITDHYDTTEILLKVALNTITLTLLVCDDVEVSISY
jgi:hypothetical protein